MQITCNILLNYLYEKNTRQYATILFLFFQNEDIRNTNFEGILLVLQSNLN